ncbi:MAG TPA: hypothetical protein VI230_02110, partial [Ignavibacteriaceae bacterium]
IYDLSALKMEEELRVIKNELHCNAVRIYGGDLEKLVLCAEIAIKEGLMVWFSPRNINASLEETFDYIMKCSAAAEDLRKISPGTVYVIGNEFSLDAKGFIKGEIIYERISNLSRPVSIIMNAFGLGFNKELNAFLEKAVSAARQNFKGEITYASGQWEKINWDIFDIAAVNYYRNGFNAWKYRRTVRKLVLIKKKFTITEFGCCGYRGAAQKGAWGYAVIDWSMPRPRLTKQLIRDEAVQAKYLDELLNIYLAENVHAVFVYTFVARRAIYDPNPEYDLDMANFGIIKVLPSEINDSAHSYKWERKKAFSELSEFYLKF